MFLKLMGFLKKPVLNRKLAIVLIAGLAVLLIVFVFLFWGKSETEKLPFVPEEKNVEVFSLTAIISRVDGKKKLIVAKHPVENKEITVDVGDVAEIFRIKFVPVEGEKDVFSQKLIKIALGDLKPGDHALIETDENIYQKTSFDAVKRIQVLP